MLRQHEAPTAVVIRDHSRPCTSIQDPLLTDTIQGYRQQYESHFKGRLAVENEACWYSKVILTLAPRLGIIKGSIPKAFNCSGLFRLTGLLNLVGRSKKADSSMWHWSGGLSAGSAEIHFLARIKHRKFQSFWYCVDFVSHPPCLCLLCFCLCT